MPSKRVTVAIAYDFDGTLSPGNMQEYDFIPKVGSNTPAFWREVVELSEAQGADRILAYMQLMLKKARESHVPIRRRDFANFGKRVKLFNGVVDWFARINAHARAKGLAVEHYIISSGLVEMIEATPIARSFKKIFASAYMYDQNGVAHWPALAINYTTKTQYLFRINKGTLSVTDDSRINQVIDPRKRPIPFERMIFIGDGSTDIPTMKLLKEQGGHSIAVFRPSTAGAKSKVTPLIEQARVNFIAPADYREGRRLDLIVKALLDKMAADVALMRYK